MRTINAISKILQHVCICQNQCIIEPKYVKTGLNLYFNHISEGGGGIFKRASACGNDHFIFQ